VTFALKKRLLDAVFSDFQNAAVLLFFTLSLSLSLSLSIYSHSLFVSLGKF